MTPQSNLMAKTTKNILLAATWNNPFYYKLSRQFDQEFIKSSWFKLLKRYCAHARSILDIGCGEGTNLSHLCPPGASAAGIDISPLAIRLARKSYPHLKFQVADAESIPFPNASFDFCYNIGTLEHLTRPERVIEEMIRVTKKGGLIAFWTINFGSPFVKPHTATYSPAKKIAKQIIASFYYLFHKPFMLNWDKINPRITSGKEFSPDDDMVTEPNLQTLVSFLKKRNLKIIYASSGWDVQQKESPKTLIRAICKIANWTRLSALPPFKYWGNNLFLIAQVT
ncbi:hypothetical protein B5M47_00265 [candidate division CPR3 bacterium 4484_211]|uniref:Methyltransferase type 11 domain-containing protein n=1 Tax=candidate division CPR3 bacterium 4484_211 TaxID=1968527 RepID=A0A1W9NZG8_UNCC3|nr:MAG: hypothetical protein B5M47_00265 [candidate division CPR3 bacterium 4484_211]